MELCVLIQCDLLRVFYEEKQEVSEHGYHNVKVRISKTCKKNNVMLEIGEQDLDYRFRFKHTFTENTLRSKSKLEVQHLQGAFPYEQNS